jgi:hypothetical protein
LTAAHAGETAPALPRCGLAMCGMSRLRPSSVQQRPEHYHQSRAAAAAPVARSACKRSAHSVDAIAGIECRMRLVLAAHGCPPAAAPVALFPTACCDRRALAQGVQIGLPWPPQPLGQGQRCRRLQRFHPLQRPDAVGPQPGLDAPAGNRSRPTRDYGRTGSDGACSAVSLRRRTATCNKKSPPRAWTYRRRVFKV